jgi:hypothetical protein
VRDAGERPWYRGAAPHGWGIAGLIVRSTRSWPCFRPRWERGRERGEGEAGAETRTVRSQRRRPAGVGAEVSPAAAAGTERSACQWFLIFFFCDVGKRRERVGPSVQRDADPYR